MSCYFRHLNEIFTQAGIEVTPENRRKIDQAIHNLMKTEYNNCPDAWRKIKAEVLADNKKRDAFIIKLKQEADMF